MPCPDVLWTSSCFAEGWINSTVTLHGARVGFWQLAVVELGNVPDGMMCTSGVYLNSNLLFSCETNHGSKKNKDTPELGLCSRSGWSVTSCMSGPCLDGRAHYLGSNLAATRSETFRFCVTWHTCSYININVVKEHKSLCEHLQYIARRSQMKRQSIPSCPYPPPN